MNQEALRPEHAGEITTIPFRGDVVVVDNTTDGCSSAGHSALCLRQLPASLASRFYFGQNSFNLRGSCRQLLAETPVDVSGGSEFRGSLNSF